jgi:capping protein beta
LYYGKSSLSSVCLWDEGITEGGFAGCFLIRNTTKDSVNGKDDSVAKWSSIHILEALHTEEKWMYAITSTIFISITHPEGTISGSLTKQHKRVCNSSKERHIANVGKLIEDVEHEMRSQLEGVYIPKTRVDYIMNSRKQEGSGASVLRKDLADAVLRRGVEGRVKLS